MRFVYWKPIKNVSISIGHTDDESGTRVFYRIFGIILNTQDKLDKKESSDELRSSSTTQYNQNPRTFSCHHLELFCFLDQTHEFFFFI